MAVRISANPGPQIAAGRSETAAVAARRRTEQIRETAEKERTDRARSRRRVEETRREVTRAQVREVRA